MFGIGTFELLVLALIGLMMLGGGVAVLVVISLALLKKDKQDPSDPRGVSQ